MSGKTAGQQAYEARWIARGRRLGAGDTMTDSEVIAVVTLPWDVLPPGMRADEEAAAAAVETEQLRLAREDRDQLRKRMLDLAAEFERDSTAGFGLPGMASAAVRLRQELDA